MALDNVVWYNTAVAPAAPAFTSADNTSFTENTLGTFTVSTTGAPPSTISVSGTLPSGVTFTDNGNGTGTLAGTPASGTAGNYPLTFTASNGVTPDAVQNFTLTVSGAAPTPPSFAISDVTANEGNAAVTSFVFTVTKTGATASSSTIDFTTADGTATIADGDYQSNSGTLTFAAGDTTMMITVLVTGDTTTEPDETFLVNLSNPTNGTISDNQGIGTIVNDETASTGTIPGGTYTNLNVGASATLGGNVTVTGTLAINDGIITTGANTLTLSQTGTYTRGTGFVEGNFSKLFPVTANGSFEFPVGTVSGPDDGYTPVTLTNLNVAAAGDGLTVAAFDTDAPDALGVARVSRYRQLTEIGSITTTLTFTYLTSEQATFTDLARRAIFRGALNACNATSVCSFAVNGGNTTATITNVDTFSPWAIAQLVPTAASVEVGGRVLQPNGRGIAGARVMMIDSQGESRIALTNQFGYYRFTEVDAGGTYIFSVTHRRYQFAQSTQIQSVVQDTLNINFVSSEVNQTLKSSVRLF